MRLIFSVICFLPLTVLPAANAGMTEEQSEVVDAVVRHLAEDYVDAEVGQQAAAGLQSLARSGELDGLPEGEPFAQRLSAALQSLTSDGHLNVEYSDAPIDPEPEPDASWSAAQMERWYGAHINFGVQAVERLNGNVGYLDLRVFAPLDMGGETLVAAMNVLANMNALVIDLRRNGGGMGDAADLVASYLFEAERQPLTGVYDRPSDTLTQRFTQPFVPGKRFGGKKPVYVLISEKTFSAAEALAYNLQALERAVIVGETSGGGAHPFDYLPVTDHYVLWSVTARSVNPVTGGNWQGVGVTPDIEVVADSALEAALTHLEAQ